MARATEQALVLGGGVAGIAAAVTLADAGLRVRLVEKRPLLGGRASSFIDGERRIDEGQHATLRCCTQLAALFEKLGVQDKIRWLDTIHYLDRQGRISTLSACALPAPLHTAVSFWRLPFLTASEKLAISRALLAVLRHRPAPKDDDSDVASWLRERGQPPAALERFWRPILIGSCNEELDRISLGSAVKVLREGLLQDRRAFHLGVPAAPLADLYTEPAIAYLGARGGCASLRATVASLVFDGERIAGARLVGGEEIEAEAVVSALPFDQLLKLLPAERTEGVDYFENLRRLESSPIVGVHLWLDRSIDCPHALCLLDRESQWVFNKSRNFGLPESDGTYLSVVISAARRMAALPKEEVLEIVAAELRECLPEMREAQIRAWRVVKARKATFCPLPGVEALRPDQHSPISGLYVAGEWTRTGWPSTMEGAALSGIAAASYLLDDLGAGSSRYQGTLITAMRRVPRR
jgi:zeta-carotene desaturase